MGGENGSGWPETRVKVYPGKPPGRSLLWSETAQDLTGLTAQQMAWCVWVHDASVQSREEYDGRIGSTRDKLWKGCDLPFDVLLDEREHETPAATDRVATGTTIRRYGIKGFPTTIVIDQQGFVAARVPRIDQLEPLIRKLLGHELADGS